MILIGGDKYPQSMTGVRELTDADVAGTTAIAALNLWVPDFGAVGMSLTPIPLPKVFTYPADARGYWVTVASSDPVVLSVDNAEETYTPNSPGTVTLTWTVSNADGSEASYAQQVTVVTATVDRR